VHPSHDASVTLVLSKQRPPSYSGVVSFFLRNAIAFGASPRQRFDLVLNNLAGFAFTAAKIRVMSDGTPCSPLVHVEDVYQAIPVFRPVSS
jgi:hypothetical protein